MRGEIVSLTAISAFVKPSATAARYYIEAFEYGYGDEGNYLVGGQIVIESIEELYAIDQGSVVSVSVTQESSTLYNQTGDLLEKNKSVETTITALVEYIENHWKLTLIGTL